MSRVREIPAVPKSSPCPVEPITARGHQTEPTSDATTRFVTPLTRVERPLKRWKVWKSVKPEAAYAMNLPVMDPARYVIAPSQEEAESFYAREVDLNTTFFVAKSKLLED